MNMGLIQSKYSIESDNDQSHSSQQSNIAAPTTTMDAKPKTGHKRTHSSGDGEPAASGTAASGATTSERKPPTRALLLHLNALLHCKEAITRTIHKLVEEALGGRDIPNLTEEAILRAFTKSPLIFEIFARLGITDLTPEEYSRLVECYPRIYSLEGMPLVCLAPGAKEFLEEVKRHDDVAFAVMSNNPRQAAALLAQFGVSELIDAILPTTGAQAHSTGPMAYELFWENWQEVVLPWLSALSDASTSTDTSRNDDAAKDSDTNMGTGPDVLTTDHGINNIPTITVTNDTGKNTAVPPLQPEQVTVVSCALYDLGIAKVTGMHTCWIKKVDIDDEAAMRASGSLDLVAESLEELRGKLFVGESNSNLGVKLDPREGLNSGRKVQRWEPPQREDLVREMLESDLVRGEDGIMRPRGYGEDEDQVMQTPLVEE